jgi:hypothetical protein
MALPFALAPGRPRVGAFPVPKEIEILLLSYCLDSAGAFFVCRSWTAAIYDLLSESKNKCAYQHFVHAALRIALVSGDWSCYSFAVRRMGAVFFEESDSAPHLRGYAVEGAIRPAFPEDPTEENLEAYVRAIPALCEPPLPNDSILERLHDCLVLGANVRVGAVLEMSLSLGDSRSQVLLRFGDAALQDGYDTYAPDSVPIRSLERSCDAASLERALAGSGVWGALACDEDPLRGRPLGRMCGRTGALDSSRSAVRLCVQEFYAGRALIAEMRPACCVSVESSDAVFEVSEGSAAVPIGAEASGAGAQVDPLVGAEDAEDSEGAESAEDSEGAESAEDSEGAESAEDSEGAESAEDAETHARWAQVAREAGGAQVDPLVGAEDSEGAGDSESAEGAETHARWAQVAREAGGAQVDPLVGAEDAEDSEGAESAEGAETHARWAQVAQEAGLAVSRSSNDRSTGRVLVPCGARADQFDTRELLKCAMISGYFDGDSDDDTAGCWRPRALDPPPGPRAVECLSGPGTTNGSRGNGLP